MDEIKQFKKEHNGDYVKYTTKELIGGLHKKFDNQQEVINTLKTDVTWLKRLVFTLYGLIGSVLFKPAKTILQKIFGG